MSSKEVKKDKKDMQMRAMIKDIRRINKDFNFKGDFKELQEIYHSFVNQKPLIENKEDKIKKELLTLIDKNKINIFLELLEKFKEVIINDYITEPLHH